MAHRQLCLGLLAMPRTALRRNQPTVSTPVLAHSLQPPGFSAAENADWGHSNHWVQLSHSDCFAAVLWKVCLNHLISQHSWSVFTCVCICVCSQSSTHHVCDIPYVVQRSQPHSSWASLSHSSGLVQGRVARTRVEADHYRVSLNTRIPGSTGPIASSLVEKLSKLSKPKPYLLKDFSLCVWVFACTCVYVPCLCPQT